MKLCVDTAAWHFCLSRMYLFRSRSTLDSDLVITRWLCRDWQLHSTSSSPCSRRQQTGKGAVWAYDYGSNRDKLHDSS